MGTIVEITLGIIDMLLTCILISMIFEKNMQNI